ncbi:MAG: T9SS type A sorting domain-containing protein [Sphingobacteriales bacterium]|nr:MAG: T9SS type A sorting domain-containing protein [Sphingobacteriales bacterium]
MPIRYYLLLLFVLGHLPLQAQVKFALPLHGTPRQDYWIVNYVDHDAGTALLDNSCGNKTYDGHQGTDMVLRSFKTMDSGVVVYAMADGVVFQTKDSLYDRSKIKNNGGLGNYIGINHGNQYWAYYGHFKAHTLLVKPGDVVTEGQPIAMVGSSGNTTDPHLHIEVYDVNSNIVDPFAGNCQTNTASLWKSQPAYDTSFLVIDKGFTAYVPNLDTLRERYDIRNNIYTHSDTAINFWIQTQGVHTGDVQRVDWYTPNATFWYSYSYTTPADYWYSYFWTYINIPPDTLAGTWSAQYFVNNMPVTTEYVNVLPWPTGVQSLQQADWQLYPNPATTSIRIVMPKAAGKKVRAQLYDVLGKSYPVYEGPLQSSQNIALPNVPAGTYILQLYADDVPAGKKRLMIVR